jgi:KRAB domain-containing zinc finger protein
VFGEHKFNCDQCDLNFLSKLHLKKHIYRAHKCKFECESGKCRAKFATLEGLVKHQKKKHSKGSCDICKRTFKDANALKIHRYGVHNKRFECKICLKNFGFKRDLDMHFSKHGGVKLFSCSICCKEFSDRSNYKRHVRTHGGAVKKHSCTICNRIFTRKASLQQHLLTHSGEQASHSCFCGKSYTTRS